VVRTKLQQPNIAPIAQCLTCMAPLGAQRGRGRRRQYCSDSCRSAARRARQPKPELLVGRSDAWDEAIRAETRVLTALMMQVPGYRPYGSIHQQPAWIRVALKWAALDWLALHIITETGPLTGWDLRVLPSRLRRYAQSGDPLVSALAGVVLSRYPLGLFEGQRLARFLHVGISAGLIARDEDPLKSAVVAWSVTKRGLAALGRVPWS
jgi:hypothetical protein